MPQISLDDLKEVKLEEEGLREEVSARTPDRTT